MKQGGTAVIEFTVLDDYEDVIVKGFFMFLGFMGSTARRQK
jgi:hypothetical protein